MFRKPKRKPTTEKRPRPSSPPSSSDETSLPPNDAPLPRRTKKPSLRHSFGHPTATTLPEPEPDPVPTDTRTPLDYTTNKPRNPFLAGPIRAPSFVRTTARFDYQPDICKDYKETGFCGFGDTCIYLHDRGDSKSGWELEREYEEKKRGEEERRRREVELFMSGGVEEGGGEEVKVEEDGIPFACHLCRGPFVDPMVTVCHHYFCEGCMSARIRAEGSGCPVCRKDTHGVLNFPQKLVAKKRRLVGRDGSWVDFLEKKRGKEED